MSSDPNRQIPLHVGIKKWKKNEWISFILIFLFLALHLIIAGYPIIDWDSIRYLNGALFLKPDSFAPTLTCYLISPLVALMGAWGFTIFQIAILTYTLVSALRFFNKGFTIGLISIIMSAAGYFAILVMMDIYAAIGLLALFLILNGNKDILLHIILSICYIAHYENVFLFPLSAVIYWTIFNRKNFNLTLLPITILFIIPLIGAILTNYWAEEDFRFFSKGKYSMTATRIMADSPEIISSYMEEYPDSDFSKHKEFIKYAISNGTKIRIRADSPEIIRKYMEEYPHSDLSKRKKFYKYAKIERDPFHVLFWDAKGGFGHRLDYSKLNKESRKFVLYALKNYKLALLNNIFKNTYKFLIRPGLKLGMANREKPINIYIKTVLPNQLEHAKNSLQYKGGLPLINFKLIYMVCYYTSLPVILFFISLSFINRKIRDSKYYSFAVFAVILILANACIMSNFVGIYLRFQLRVMLLPCLAMVLIVANFLKMGRTIVLKS